MWLEGPPWRSTGRRIALVDARRSKSTLLACLTGSFPPDRGEVSWTGVTTALVEQQVPGELAGSIYDLVAAGLAEAGQLLAEFHHVSRKLAARDEPALRAQLDRLNHQLDAAGAWRVQQHVETVLSRMQLDADAEVSTLSAGEARAPLASPRRRPASCADEPTNHLDIATIEWLEEFLIKQVETLLFVTHDRRFLKRLATRVLDLDRGRLTSWACGYDAYVARKEAVLAAEAVQQAEFDRRLAQEEKWIRTGILARRTRNEGRARRLINMRRQRQDRRERAGSARMQLQEAERSGRLVAELKGVSFTYGDRPIIRHLSTLVMRGDRIGIIGPNGAGKTTLLRVILGQLPPTEGAVRHGTRLQVAYFDQLHAQLDLQKSVVENLAGGSDSVLIAGKKKHVYGYLQFPVHGPAAKPRLAVSGGEGPAPARPAVRQASNVLVMAETDTTWTPRRWTCWKNPPGHTRGRCSLSATTVIPNNVVTSTLVFEGEGEVHDYAGGYDDWLVQRSKTPPDDVRKPEKPKPEKARKKPAERRLTYKEKMELETLPRRIEELERKQRELHDTMADPAFYQQDRQSIVEKAAELETVDQQLAEAYERWEELECIGG